MHGLWLEMFGWVVGLVLILVIGLFVGSTAAFWLYVLFALWFGSAASDLRVAALARTGYLDAGARVAADDMMPNTISFWSRRNERTRHHHRLRIGQSQIGGQGFRALGPRNRHRLRDQSSPTIPNASVRRTASFCPASAPSPIAAPAFLAVTRHARNA